jgi:inhibitor of KinA
MNLYHPYTIFPLGDTALTIEFGNTIDEDTNNKVLHLFDRLKKSAVSQIKDLIPAYSSLTVYYDVAAFFQRKTEDKSAFETMAEFIEDFTAQEGGMPEVKGKLIEVPVCYSRQYGTDLEGLADHKNISVEEVIRLHLSRTYRVYMIGFLPGFAYMGEVEEEISMPRKPEPKPVVAGSVGIAGRQTGIYPLPSPGGWHIIGRSPVQVFNRNRKDTVLFSPGDKIKFYSITEDEFAHYQNRGA